MGSTHFRTLPIPTLFHSFISLLSTHYTPPTPKDNLMKFVTQNESALNEHLHRTTKD